MKVQDVLLKAMAKKINWLAAAEIIGVSDRTMRRWRIGMEKFGYSGLADRRKGKASPQRISVATVEEVLRLYREEYYDLNIRHFHEKLQDEHDIRLSYTWVQKALQGAGLVAKRHKRGPHRRRRPRRPLPGMLLHIDGSKHLHGTDGACGGKGQHRGHPRPLVANRPDTIPQQLGGKHGNDPRTPGWNRLDPLRPSRGRTF